MEDNIIPRMPTHYRALLQATKASGFSMASDVMTCSLLRTLAASKPRGRFLELGAGTGLSTAWILDGMDDQSSLLSIDNDASVLEIARTQLGSDSRLTIIQTDGGEWVAGHQHETFDFIFADTWHGKYLALEEVLLMVNPGGFYIIDDMMPQPNWPEGHAEKVAALLSYLDAREDFTLTRQSWASGLVIAVRNIKSLIRI